MEARRLEPRAWQFGEAMDLLGRGVLALDPMGFVLEANATARTFFGEEMRISERRLRLRDPRASAELAVLMARLRTELNLAQLSRMPIVIRRIGKPPLVLRLYPVGDVATHRFRDACAVLMLSEMRVSPITNPTVLARAFGLSRAEARVASLIAGGLGLAAAAQQLGISREAARSQLRAVFAKTETSRQSELAALLAQLG